MPTILEIRCFADKKYHSGGHSRFVWPPRLSIRILHVIRAASNLGASIDNELSVQFSEPEL